MADALHRRTAAFALALALALLAGAVPVSVVPAWAVEASSLLALPGKVVGVRYAPGSLDRAVRVQRPFERMARELRAWTGQKPSFAVYLFERSDWERAGLGLPYGMPARMAPSVVAQSAWGDAETVAFWRRLLGADPPAPTDSPLRGSPGEAASLLPGDLLGLVEGARSLLEGSGVGGDRLWVSELLAHAVAVDTMERYDPGRLELADRFYALCRGPRPRARPLEEYSTGLTLESWLWFQGAFYEGARVLTTSGDRGVVKELVKRAAKRGPLSGERLLEQREAVADWHRVRFAPTAR